MGGALGAEQSSDGSEPGVGPLRLGLLTFQPLFHNSSGYECNKMKMKNIHIKFPAVLYQHNTISSWFPGRCGHQTEVAGRG